MATRWYKTIKMMPYYNWQQASKDVRWVRVDFDEYAGDYDEKKNPNGNTRAKREDYDTFNQLQEEFVRYFGMNETVLDLHNLQKELLIAQIDSLLNPVYMNDVWRIEYEIEQVLKSSTEAIKVDIEEQLIDVEIWMKRELDLRVTSVFKLNLILKKFEQHCKDQNALIEKHKNRG